MTFHFLISFKKLISPRFEITEIKWNIIQNSQLFLDGPSFLKQRAVHSITMKHNVTQQAKKTYVEAMIL
jgi:hypothetical protein